jgi:hypothetical protein
MRILITAVVAAGLALAGTASAAAAQPSTPVTITLSPEQVAHLCEKRLPKVENRVTKALERINGGPEVRGSTAWLKKRAEAEKAAGRETSAQLLEERAERRAGRVDELNKVKGWVTDFRSKYCGGSK